MDGPVLSINVIETSLKKSKWSLALKYSNVLACFTLRIFTGIRFVFMPLRSEIIHCLTHALFVTLITGKEIHQTFVSKDKLKVYSPYFS